LCDCVHVAKLVHLLISVEQKVNKDGLHKVAVIIGSSEVDSGSVTLRCLTSASQQLVPVGQLSDHIRALQQHVEPHQ
jgi:histidyl-tRNA synthetase